MLSKAWLQFYAKLDPFATILFLNSDGDLSLNIPYMHLEEVASLPSKLDKSGRWCLLFRKLPSSYEELGEFINMVDRLEENIRVIIVEVSSIVYFQKYYNKSKYSFIILSSNNTANNALVLCPFSHGRILSNIKALEDSVCSVNLLSGKTLKVSVVGLSPYVIYSKDAVGGRKGDLDILEIVSRKYGFSYNLKLERFWYAYVNGTALGTYASVDKGDSTIGIGSPMPDLDVNGPPIDIETTPHLYALEIGFIGPKPKPMLPFWNLIKPLSLTVWFCVLAVIFLHLALVHSLNLLHPVSIYMIVLGQSSQHNRDQNLKLSSRVVFASWVLCSFIIVSSYECNLRAYIVAVDYEKPIDSSSDILEQNKKLYVPTGSGLIKFMEISTIEKYRVLAKRVKRDGSILTLSGGLIAPEVENKIYEEGSVFIYDKEMAYNQFDHIISRRGHIPYRVAREPYATLFVKFLLQRQMPWNVGLGKVLTNLNEAGIIQYNIRKYRPLRANLKNRASTTTLEAFGLSHFYGSNIVILLGLMGGMLALSIEYTCKPNKRRI